MKKGIKLHMILIKVAKVIECEFKFINANNIRGLSINVPINCDVEIYKNEEYEKYISVYCYNIIKNIPDLENFTYDDIVVLVHNHLRLHSIYVFDDSLEINRLIRYGEVYYVDFNKIQSDVPNIQHGIRPAVIVSNNKNNAFCNLVTVIPLTTKKDSLPQHQAINVRNLKNYLMPECIMTISKERLNDKIWTIYDSSDLKKIKKCMKIQFNM